MTSGSEEPPTTPASATATPQILLQQAAAAVQGQAQESASHDGHDQHSHHHHGTSPHLEDVPPAPYNGAGYGQLDISQNGMDTGAKLASDGRINIKINQRNHKLCDLLVPALRKQLDLQRRAEADEPAIPEGLGDVEGLPPPPMNIVVQIVGSRGDVQPFIALGQVLKNKYNHRVRIATHPVFRDFVTENGLEFFSIGGDPAELMAFMVKNPGLMPGMDSLKNGDIGKRRKNIYELVTGCWRSCIEAGDGTGISASDDRLDGQSFDSTTLSGDPSLKPFVADAIIANPPSFAHVHIAEKLGIPLHLMFTMPWSPTQSFPHPLANIISSNTDPNMANFVTYALVDMLTWQGLGDVINKFRERSLGLEPVSIMWAPGMASRLRIPWTYCWSPALIPKPADWGRYIDISGFYFLNLASAYTPDKDLADFLAAGPPPVYIGFGSIVVDDPNAMTKMIFEAIKKSGQRALVSKGWGGLGANELGIPEGVFMLGNCPHDWLFKQVSCVVHHGGAGTTAAGISAGRPTVVVPFFGDQPFWGAMCARAGAGPMPIPYKNLTADKLASQIVEALKPESLDKAKELSEKIKQEDGTDAGAKSFHKQLHLEDLRCSLCPDRIAVWRVKRTDIRLSTLAATVLGNEGLLDFTDLKLYRSREYETEDGPWDPISGGAAALIGTIGNLSMGVADFPVELLKSLKSASHDVYDAHEKHRKSTSGTPTASARTSSIDLSRPGPSSSTSTPSLASPASETGNPHESLTAATLSPPVAGAGLGANPVERRPSAMSTVASNSSETHRRWSHSHERSASPSTYGDRPPKPHDDIGHITVESAIGGARAAGRIASAGMKSPMDFTLSLAKGFHNAPKLYGDDTVRKSEKVTGFASGLKVAGKEFGYGFYDGITGLVTQPMRGARKEGAAGFMKGAAKGIGGLILKPGAAVWSIPAYSFQGVYAEISKLFGSSVQNYIIAARTAQGYEEWKNSLPEQRTYIVEAWKSSKLESKRGGKKYGGERQKEIEGHILTHTPSNSVQLVHGFKNTRHLSWDERKVLAERRKELEKEKKESEKRESETRKSDKRGGKVKSRCKYCPFDHDSDHHLKATSSFPMTSQPPHYGRSKSREEIHAEFEEAIKRSVTATSRGDPNEDARIERAIRASVQELEDANAEGHAYDSEAYQRAVQASIEEAQRGRNQEKQENGITTAHVDAHELGHDRELAEALHRSLEEHSSGTQANHDGPREITDSRFDADHDDDFRKTIEESKRLHTESELAKHQSLETTTELPENGSDPDLQKALTESQAEATKNADALAKQRTEEDIVLEYVKKQSLLEEQYRQQRSGENVSG